MEDFAARIVAAVATKRATKALAGLAFAASTAAHAGLIGDEVQARWIYAPGDFDQTSTFVVGHGTELVGGWGLGHDLDVGDNYIEAAIKFVSGIGDGVNWQFSSLDFGGIGGFSVSTNFSGWNDSWLSFTSDSIEITFFNLVLFPFGEGHIRITLLPVSAQIAEPASGLLLLAGLAVLLLSQGAIRVERGLTFIRGHIQRRATLRCRVPPLHVPHVKRWGSTGVTTLTVRITDGPARGALGSES
jgi:hypothetical protein